MVIMALLMEVAHHRVQVEVEEEHQGVVVVFQVVIVVVLVVVDQVALQEGVEGVSPQITLLVQVILVIFHFIV